MKKPMSIDYAFLKNVVLYAFFLSSINNYIFAFIPENNETFSNVIKGEGNDTLEVKKLNKIAWDSAPSNFEKSVLYADSALQIATKIGWKKGVATSYNLIGEANLYKGNIQTAIQES